MFSQFVDEGYSDDLRHVLHVNPLTQAGSHCLQSLITMLNVNVVFCGQI